MIKSTISCLRSRPLQTGSSLISAASLFFAGPAFAQTYFSEDFESLPLGPAIDEGLKQANVWTETPPADWTQDDSRMPGVGNPALDGVTEWAGWGFANKAWWVQTAGQQRREEFIYGTGTVAIADPDEWDDADHAVGFFDASVTTKTITTPDVAANSLVLAFDSSWRPEARDDPNAARFPVDSEGLAINNQTAIVRAAFGASAATEILRWDSISDSGFYHEDGTYINEAVLLPLNNPAGAAQLKLTFAMELAANDWWWAVDNITVGSPPLMVGLAATGVDFTARIAEGLGKTVDQTKPITVTLDGTPVTPGSVTPEGNLLLISYSQAPQVWTPKSTHTVRVAYTSNEGKAIEESRTFVAPSYTTASSTPNVVTAIITDPTWFTVAQGDGVTLKLDGNAVTPNSVARAEQQVIIKYSQGATLFEPNSPHTLEVTFKTTEGEDVVDTVAFTAPDWKILPPSLATAAGTGAQPGVRFRAHILETARPTTIAAAEAQLRGELGASIHDTTGEVNGAFEVDFINFEENGGAAGNFSSSSDIPEQAVQDGFIPGTADGTLKKDDIAGDTRAFVEIPSTGLYTMVVNSDDGFQLSTGTTNSPNYLVLGSWDAGRGAADSPAYFRVDQAGVYFFRLLWFEGTGGASVEWFTANEQGVRALVNGTQPNALKAYRVRTVPEPPITTPGGIESYTYTGGQFVITYGGTLKSAGTLNGTFNPVAGATSPYTVPQTENATYYTAQ